MEHCSNSEGISLSESAPLSLSSECIVSHPSHRPPPSESIHNFRAHLRAPVPSQSPSQSFVLTVRDCLNGSPEGARRWRPSPHAGGPRGVRVRSAREPHGSARGVRARDVTLREWPASAPFKRSNARAAGMCTLVTSHPAQIGSCTARPRAVRARRDGRPHRVQLRVQGTGWVVPARGRGQPNTAHDTAMRWFLSVSSDKGSPPPKSNRVLHSS